MKHKNINRPKYTAGLSIKRSINMRGLILTEGVGYKRLVLFVHDAGRGWEVLDHSVEITEAWLGFLLCGL